MQYGPNIASNFFYAPVDFAEERRIGQEVGSMNKLRDMAKGFDFNQPNAGEKFRSEGYKIDPLQTERDYGSIISKFDERQLQQAAALREKAGRAWLKIGSLPEQQRPIAWQEVQRDPELASVFDEPYSPEAYMGKESEFQSLDEALKAAAVKRKNEQIRTTLGLGQPGQPQGAAPTNYRASLARLESGGNDAAAAPGSSAKGRYQFIDSTWAQLGMDPALVNDPNAQERAMDKFLEQNAKTFQAKNGRLPNDAEQYAYHWFGPGNGQRVLTANPDTPIERIIGQKTAENNGLSGQTAGQVRSALEQRMGTGTTWTGEPQGSDLPAPQSQPADTSPQAIFAGLPQWQQQDVLNSADDAEAMQKIGKYAAEANKPAQTRTRPLGDEEITEEYRNGQWVEVSRAPRWKQESAAPGPFGSTALEAQAYNIVSAYEGKKAAGQQTTAQEDFDYSLAIRQLQQPKVIMGPDGNQYVINPEPLPQFGAQPSTPGQSPAAPNVTPVGTGNKEVNAAQVTADRVKQSLDHYRQVLTEKGEGPTKLITSPNDAALLESAYNDLMLEAKEMYKLGVLNGPDYTIMTQTLVPPTSFRAAFVDMKTMMEQLDAAEAKLNASIQSYKQRYAPAGGATESGAPAVTKRYVIENGKLVPVQ